MTLEPALGKPGVTTEAVLQAVAAALAESTSSQFRPFNVQVGHDGAHLNTSSV